MLQKQAIEEILPRGWFLSTVLLVPKKMGARDPSSTNRFVHTEHFRMKGIETCQKQETEGGPERCVLHGTVTKHFVCIQ